MHYSVLLLLASSAIAAPLANPNSKEHQSLPPLHIKQQPLPLACTDSKKWPSVSRIHTLHNKNLAQVIDPSLCLNHKGKDKKHKYGTLYQYDAKANCVLKHSVAKAPDHAKATCRQILDVSLLNHVMESKAGVCDQLDKQLKPLHQKKDRKKVHEIASHYKSLYEILNDPKNHVFVERSLGELKKEVMNRSTEVPEYNFKPNASDPHLFPRLQAVYELVNQTEKTAHAIARAVDETLKKSFHGSKMKMSLTSVLDHAIMFAKNTTTVEPGAPVPPVPGFSGIPTQPGPSGVSSHISVSSSSSAPVSTALHSSVVHSSGTASSAVHSSTASSTAHSSVVHSSSTHSSTTSSAAHSSVAPVSTSSGSSTSTHSKAPSTAAHSYGAYPVAPESSTTSTKSAPSSASHPVASSSASSSHEEPSAAYSHVPVSSSAVSSHSKASSVPSSSANSSVVHSSDKPAASSYSAPPPAASGIISLSDDKPSSVPSSSAHPSAAHPSDKPASSAVSSSHNKPSDVPASSVHSSTVQSAVPESSTVQYGKGEHGKGEDVPP